MPEHRYSRGGTVVVDNDSGTVLIYMLFVANPQLRDMLNNIEEMRDAFDDFLDDMLHEVQDVFEDLFRN